MSDEFDPYRKWLGIPPEDRPPNHYRLLGIAVFEDDQDVISNAADRQMSHVRTFQGGKNSQLSQKILNELSAAKVCLLNSATKQEYDNRLREVRAVTAAPIATPGQEPPAPLANRPPISAPPIAAAHARDKKPPQRQPEQTTSILAGTVVQRRAESALDQEAEDVPRAEEPENSVRFTAANSGHARTSGRHRRREASPVSTFIAICGVIVAVIILLAIMIAFATRSSTTTSKATTGTEPIREGGRTGRTPNQSPKHRPPAEPSPPVTPDPPRTSKEDNIRVELLQARGAMAGRDVQAARRHIEAAYSMKPSGQLEQHAADLEMLCTYLDNFWKGIDKAVGRLQVGDQFQMAGSNHTIIKIQDVQRKGRLYHVRVGSTERELRQQDLRQGLRVRERSLDNLQVFIRRGLPTEDTFSLLYNASFLLIDGRSQSSENWHRAGVLVEKAAQAGIDNATLRRELALQQ